MTQLGSFGLMSSNRPDWSRSRLVEWMFQVVGRPRDGPEPLRLRQGFSLALQILELHMPACSSLSIAIAAAYDS